MSVSGVTTIVAQASYPLVVNGYLCFNADDVKAARKHANPSAAEDRADTAAASAASSAPPASAASQLRERQSETVVPAQTDDRAQDSKWPRKEEERGQVVDLLV